MIQVEKKDEFQDILSKYPENVQGNRKLQGYQVQLQVAPRVKTVAEPPKSIPYHLKTRVEEAINEMIESDVIEEHPTGKPAPWVSNIVIAPKDDGEIRITLDAKNVNKAIMSSNFPIPRQEDIKAKLAEAKVFSKLDLKSAFWQLEIAEDSRKLTVFHANGRLFWYKRLVVGLKPAQGELKAALQPLFTQIPQAHLIHDDSVYNYHIQEHNVFLNEVMKILSTAGLTLNPKNVLLERTRLHSGDGVCPDPDEALEHMSPPRDMSKLTSFLCMIQSNAEFIPQFAKKATELRELTKKGSQIYMATRTPGLLQ